MSLKHDVKDEYNLNNIALIVDRFASLILAVSLHSCGELETWMKLVELLAPVH